MKHSIFIRTFHKDAEFLDCLLRSLQKFCTGFDETVVQCDDADSRVIAKVVGNRARMVTSRPLIGSGYLWQQHTKIHADCFTPAENITFIDSDCCAHGPINPEHFQDRGKGQILFTPYAALGNTVPWQKPTEAFLKRPVDKEFMRGMRFQIRRETLIRFRNAMRALHMCPLHEAMQRVPSFSEFNAIFAWAYEAERQNYTWLDTTCEPLPYHNLRQFPSHQGVTPAIRAEIENYLR